MAAVQHNLQMDFMYQSQMLTHQLHEMYDQRVRMLLQQKRKILVAIQLLSEQQMQSLLGSVIAMERGAAVTINQENVSIFGDPASCKVTDTHPPFQEMKGCHHPHSPSFQACAPQPVFEVVSAFQ